MINFTMKTKKTQIMDLNDIINKIIRAIIIYWKIAITILIISAILDGISKIIAP